MENNFSAVTPSQNDNPALKGWYILNDGNYVRTTDSSAQSG